MWTREHVPPKASLTYQAQQFLKFTGTKWLFIKKMSLISLNNVSQLRSNNAKTFVSIRFIASIFSIIVLGTFKMLWSWSINFDRTAVSISQLVFISRHFIQFGFKLWCSALCLLLAQLIGFLKKRNQHACVYPYYPHCLIWSVAWFNLMDIQFAKTFLNRTKSV